MKIDSDDKNGVCYIVKETKCKFKVRKSNFYIINCF